MSKAVAHSRLVKAALRGVGKAFKVYRKMSGRRFGRAPEYYVTSKIAESLAAKAAGCRVDLENSIWQGLKEAKARTSGAKHRALSATSRADITVRWKSGDPRAFFEVKHPLEGVPGLIDDVRRLRSSLARSRGATRLQFGCLVFYSQTKLPTADARKKWAKDFKKKIGEAVDKLIKNERHFLTRSIKLGDVVRDEGRGRDDDEELFWGATGSILLYRTS